MSNGNSNEQMSEILDDTDLFEHLAASESERGETASLDVTAFLKELKVIRESQAPFEIAGTSPNILHVELEGKVVGEHLVFTAPPDMPLPFTLEGNTIILGDYHISVRWKGKHDVVHDVTS